MSNWIDKYKKLIISSHKLHVIVADVDCLFDYYELEEAFLSEGFQIFKAVNNLRVRTIFELQVRNNELKSLIVAPPNYQPLPDIQLQVNFVSIGLKQIFPNLDAKAIKGLSFNALCTLSNIRLYEDLGHDKTLKFLLENLYNLDFDTLNSVKAKERIMNALISTLLEHESINLPLQNYLTKLSKPYFPELVKRELNQDNLLEYIQHQWSLFVVNKKLSIDFEETVLNKTLGYLFAFNYIKPIKVTHNQFDTLPNHFKLGAYVDTNGLNDDELNGLIGFLEQQLQTIEDIADQWFKIIQIFASAKTKSILSKNQLLLVKYKKIENAFNIRFQRFIENTYSSQFSLSGVRKPVVVSRILENIKAQPQKKRALLVIDGMNYWQWNILANALKEKGILYDAGASLAYIPTITAWSRQSIFKGEKPDLLADNSKEGKLFNSFWQKNGVPSYQIEFKKIGINKSFDINLSSPDISILGLICNDLDDIMHGTVMGDIQLNSATQQWIEESNIVSIISDIIKVGFQLFITADHGNIEASGIKNVSTKEKVGTLSRGKRHLNFSNETLLNNFVELNPFLEFGRKELSLYLKNSEAFTTENDLVVTHGGSHMWEVIVPYISINGK